MKCIESAVGITRSDCVCITAQLPTGYNTGSVFMDEISDFPINLAMFKQPGECNTMAKMLTDARDNAYRDFQNDIYKLIQTRFKSRDITFNGTIGSKNFNSNLITGAQYAGLEITALPYKGAILLLKGIYTSFNFTGSLDLTIIKSYIGEDNFTVVGDDPIVLSTVNGVITPNIISPALELPLYDASGRQIRYYLRYSTDDNVIAPKNNDLSCGCGNTENEAKRYINWRGFSTNQAGSLDQIAYYNNVMGLVPELEIKCGSSAIICDEYANNEILKTVVDNLLAYKAASNAITSLLKSDIINRYTMMEPEKLGWMASNLRRQYRNDLQWFSENMDVSAFDCFLCKESSDTFHVAGIKL